MKKGVLRSIELHHTTFSATEQSLLCSNSSYSIIQQNSAFQIHYFNNNNNNSGLSSPLFQTFSTSISIIQLCNVSSLPLSRVWSAMSSQTGAEAPLFRNSHDAARAPALAVLLGRAGGRPDPSMLVTAVCDFISDLIHSKPVLALEMSWNMAFVFVSAAMLACTTSERPNSPIRLWIVGYVLLRFMHVVLLWLTYRRHRSRWESRRGHGTQDVESQTGSDGDEGGNDSDSVVDGSSGNSSCRCVQFNSILLCWAEIFCFCRIVPFFGCYVFDFEFFNLTWVGSAQFY